MGLQNMYDVIINSITRDLTPREDHVHASVDMLSSSEVDVPTPLGADQLEQYAQDFFAGLRSITVGSMEEALIDKNVQHTNSESATVIQFVPSPCKESPKERKEAVIIHEEPTSPQNASTTKHMRFGRSGETYSIGVQIYEEVESYFNPVVPEIKRQDVTQGIKVAQSTLDFGGSDVNECYKFHGPVYFKEIMQSIEESDELCVDVETKRLTPWENTVIYGSSTKIGGVRSLRDYKRTFNCGVELIANPLRVISISTNRFKWSIDTRLWRTPEEKSQLIAITNAMSGKIWTGHNLQFDYMWIHHLNPEVKPRFLIDTMIMVTAIRADIPFQLQKMVADGITGNATGVEESGEYLKKYLDQKLARKKGKDGLSDDSDDGSLSLLALSLYYLGEKLDKSYQMPYNWIPDVLSDEHFDYCLGDITAPRIIARRLLGMKDSTPAHVIESLLNSNTKLRQPSYGGFRPPNDAMVYKSDNCTLGTDNCTLGTFVEAPLFLENKRHMLRGNGFLSYVIFEKAIHRMVKMQHRGLMFSKRHLEPYISKLIQSRDESLIKLFETEPEMKKLEHILTSTSEGMGDDFKTTLGNLVEKHTGKTLERGANGKFKLSAQVLKGQDANNPLIKNYLAVQRAVNRLKKVDEYYDATDAHLADVIEGKKERPHWAYRVHSMISIKTITGRTGSESPNTQNPVADKEFRWGFTATPPVDEYVSTDGIYCRIAKDRQPNTPLFVPDRTKSNLMLAIDYSSIEMRIASALGKRAYNAMQTFWNGSGNNEKAIDSQYASYVKKRLSWIFRLPGVEDAFANNHMDESWPDSRPRMMDGADIMDFGYYYARQLLDLKIKIQILHGGKLLLHESYKNNIDPHMLTGLSIRQRKPSLKLDYVGDNIYEYLLDLGKRVEDVDKLKKIIDIERKAAKAENFGLLYGMSSSKLWRYGKIQFNLDWDELDADTDRDAWFEMYTEVTLWHLITELTSKAKTDLYVGGYEIIKNSENGGGSFYQSTTLTGRMVFADKINKILNYQDQGTGAEIALRAIGNLPDDIAKYLVNFVHDELVFDFEDKDAQGKNGVYAQHVRKTVDSVMIDAAQELVGDKYDIQFTAESDIGDYWIH